jgi:hypothetical protein
MSDGPLEVLDTTALSDDGLWSGTLYPAAGELVAAMRIRYVNRPSAQAVTGERCNERDGMLRALRRLRRFVAANHLRLFATTTFADWPTVAGAMHDMEQFIRRCRHGHGPFPFVWTLERGERRGRLHGHLLVPLGLRRSVEVSWPHGHVDTRTCGESLGELRSQAGYLAKSFEDPVMGGQRYRIAKGFQPEAVPVEADSGEALLAQAEARMGAPAAVRNCSAILLSAQWDA